MYNARLSRADLLAALLIAGPALATAQAQGDSPIDALFSRVADWDHTQARWKDLMQVALSVQAGTVLPSMLLRKLPAQSRQNQL